MSDFDITETVGDTTIRYGDLILIGEQVLNYIATTKLGRWASPHGVTDYGMPEPEMPAELMRDFVIWTGGHSPEDYADSRDRALAFVEQTGWLQYCLDKLGSTAA